MQTFQCKSIVRYPSFMQIYLRKVISYISVLLLNRMKSDSQVLRAAGLVLFASALVLLNVNRQKHCPEHIYPNTYNNSCFIIIIIMIIILDSVSIIQ